MTNNKKYQREYMRQWRQKHPEYVAQEIINRQKWRKENLEHDKIVGKQHYWKTIKYQRQRMANYYTQQKLQVISHYTHNTLICPGCGEKRYECLTIHHNNFDGAQQRKQNKLKGGIDVYNWIIKHKYPKNLDVLCFNCNAPFKQKSKSKYQVYRDKIKLEVFSHYINPPKCAQCKITTLNVLTIDHVNGEGRKHCKLIKRHGGTSFYYWLKQNNYPQGYQVLCYNCNWIKR